MDHVGKGENYQIMRRATGGEGRANSSTSGDHYYYRDERDTQNGSYNGPSSSMNHNRNNRGYQTGKHYDNGQQSG